MESLCLANLRKHPVRTGISVLAVGVGAATVLVLVGMTEGTLNEVARRMQNADADVLYHAASYDPVVDFSAPLSETEGEKLVELFDDVDFAVPVFTERVQYLGRGHNVYGIRAEDFPHVAHGLKIVEGSLFAGDNEIVIDETIAEEGGVEPGATINVRGQPFTVSGIVQRGIPARFLVSMKALQEIEGQPGRVTFFFLKVKDPERIGAVAAAIEKRFGGSRKCILLGNYYQALAGSFKGLHQFITAMLVVSSVISFLVILLAMYTNVVDRTREIGVLKAIGASRGFIMREVIAESVLICAGGVVLGYALSVVTAHVLMRALPQLTVELTVARTAWVALLGIAAGAVGALYPATLAARSDPVRALSYE
jgi:putative ABC transport system permease protein